MMNKVEIMERYYKILGISAGFTKEEIKEAYRKKMKALHPDKVHGTLLEDTATFLSIEINEAYKYLMTHFDKHNFSKKSNDQSCYEEDIYVEGLGVLKYSLSNDFNKIKDSIKKRTGITDFNFIYEYGWRINPVLSENVKKTMKKYNVTYSMTYITEGNLKSLIINKHSENKWFISGFEEDIKQYPDKLFTDDFYSYYPQKHKSSGFGTAFTGSLFGSIAGGLLRKIFNAGGVKSGKKSNKDYILMSIFLNYFK